MGVSLSTTSRVCSFYPACCVTWLFPLSLLTCAGRGQSPVCCPAPSSDTGNSHSSESHSKCRVSENNQLSLVNLLTSRLWSVNLLTSRLWLVNGLTLVTEVMMARGSLTRWTILTSVSRIQGSSPGLRRRMVLMTRGLDLPHIRPRWDTITRQLTSFSLTLDKVSVLTFLIVLKLFLLSDCSRGQEQSNIPMILCLTRLALLGSLLITFSMALPSCLNLWCQKKSRNEWLLSPQTVEWLIVIRCWWESREELTSEGGSGSKIVGFWEN